MEWLFKAVGLCLVFSASASAGFLKAYKLTVRVKRLDFFYRGISDIRERIRVGTGETERLLNICFGNAVTFGGSVGINAAGLEKEDAEIITEFFENIGMSNSEAEYERAGVYMELVRNQREKAEKRRAELSRLYRSLGISVGAFLCIFFL